MDFSARAVHDTPTIAPIVRAAVLPTDARSSQIREFSIKAIQRVSGRQSSIAFVPSPLARGHAQNTDADRLPQAPPNCCVRAAQKNSSLLELGVLPQYLDPPVISVAEGCTVSGSTMPSRSVHDASDGGLRLSGNPQDLEPCALLAGEEGGGLVVADDFF
jgi:hypothetical protein